MRKHVLAQRMHVDVGPGTNSVPPIERRRSQNSHTSPAGRSTRKPPVRASVRRRARSHRRHRCGDEVAIFIARAAESPPRPFRERSCWAFHRAIRQQKTHLAAHRLRAVANARASWQNAAVRNALPGSRYVRSVRQPTVSEIACRTAHRVRPCARSARDRHTVARARAVRDRDRFRRRRPLPTAARPVAPQAIRDRPRLAARCRSA